MPNFGLSRRDSVNASTTSEVNWKRGLLRIWMLISAGWIMGWTIYLLLEGVQGSLTSTRDFIEVPILLFAPPIALWLFGLAAAWTVRGFDPEH
jgi:hypothetical protein